MKTYHLIGIIFCALFIFGCQSQTSWMEAELTSAMFQQEGTKKLSAVNPENIDFGGGRGSNQLIAYTPSFGQRTKTNGWGVEAVVKNGQVISVGGNNSTIPEDGIVISGNENAMRWIIDNLAIGMNVELQGQNVYYTSSENSFIVRARDYYQRTLDRFESGKMTNEQCIKDASQQLQTDFDALISAKNSNNTETLLQCCTQLEEHAQKLYYNSYEPQEGELKGIWIRLKDKTPEELKATIKKIADAGFNAIVPETIYNGYAIYPNAHPLLPQLPQFIGWDPLQLMIDECNKYDIQVVPWCEIFFVGQAESPIVKQKPEWIGKFRTGKNYSDLETQFHYLCPSEPEARKYILNTIDTLLSRYPLAHIQYDYIRYSRSEPWDKGYCYCERCRSKVRHQLDFDIMKISPENTEEWEKWNEYRISNITSFVETSRKLFTEKHPNVKFSVDVVSDPKESLEQKFQDWSAWVKQDLVDEVYIMNYYVDNAMFRSDTKNLKEVVSGTRVKPIVGLGPFMKLRPETLLEQIEISRENGAGGVCLFAFNSMSVDQLKALTYGPFRKAEKDVHK